MKGKELEILYSQVEKIEETNKKHIEENRLFMNRLWKLISVCKYGLVKSPVGIFVKRCPDCNNKLEREYPYGDYVYRTCTCGYEWAECHIRDRN